VFSSVRTTWIKRKIIALGWEEEAIQLALKQIICRTVYPFSKNKSSRWIKENSTICGITGYPIDKITKDKLYRSALNLYKIKDSLENIYPQEPTNSLIYKIKFIFMTLPIPILKVEN